MGMFEPGLLGFLPDSKTSGRFWVQNGSGVKRPLFSSDGEFYRADGSALSGIMPYAIAPSGGADDTALVQAAITAYPMVTLKAGTYKINAVTRITVPSNRTIIFEEGAILEVIGNAATAYQCLYLNNVSNIELIHPQIRGDRLTHTGAEGEYGHGIFIAGCTNVRVYSPYVENCRGDGIYVNDITNGYMENVWVKNNRRNGFTLVCGNNFLVNGILAEDTNGTSPQCGIDIEPNDDGEQLKNIIFRNVVTRNNEAYGLNISPFKLTTAHDINILIDGHIDDESNNGFGIYSMWPTEQMTGAIVLNNPIYRKNWGSGIVITDYYADKTVPVIINRPVIHDPNECNTSYGSADSYPEYYSGIAICRVASNAGTLAMGNVHIIEPTIIDSRTVSRMKYGIVVKDSKQVAVQKIQVLNPLQITGDISGKIGKWQVLNTLGMKIVDDLGATKVLSTVAANTWRYAYIREFRNTGAGVLTWIDLLTEVGFDAPVTFINDTAFGLSIYPHATGNILPLSAVNGKYISTTVVGASITLRRISTASWYVENMVGTWTVEG